MGCKQARALSAVELDKTSTGESDNTSERPRSRHSLSSSRVHPDTSTTTSRVGYPQDNITPSPPPVCGLFSANGNGNGGNGSCEHSSTTICLNKVSLPKDNVSESAATATRDQNPTTLHPATTAVTGGRLIIAPSATTPVNGSGHTQNVCVCCTSPFATALVPQTNFVNSAASSSDASSFCSSGPHKPKVSFPSIPVPSPGGNRSASREGLASNVDELAGSCSSSLSSQRGRFGFKMSRSGNKEQAGLTSCGQGSPRGKKSMMVRRCTTKGTVSRLNVGQYEGNDETCSHMSITSDAGLSRWSDRDTNEEIDLDCISLVPNISDSDSEYGRGLDEMWSEEGLLPESDTYSITKRGDTGADLDSMSTRSATTTLSKYTTQTRARFYLCSGNEDDLRSNLSAPRSCKDGIGSPRHGSSVKNRFMTPSSTIVSSPTCRSLH